MKAVLPQLSRYNLRPLPSENLEANPTLGQHADGFDQVTKAAPQAVELPHAQNIAFTQCLEAGFKAGSVILLARREI